MTDIVSDFLERAKRARGDPQLQAALAAEFAVAARPEPEQTALRASLNTAALLHWFDAGLLEKMLETSLDEARGRVQALKSLPFVERYRRSESELQNELFNVHEATRLGWRRQMARTNPDGFHSLSSRAAECFAEDLTPAGRIEYIYHLLCGDPERGASELEELSRDWIGYSNAHPEDYYALATVLRELEDAGLVQGRARASTLLAIGWAQLQRGKTPELLDLATEALRLARDSADRRMESDAQSLVGAVLEARGPPLAGAQAAFAECLAISRRLAEQNPGNADWQRDLAVAHCKVGDILKVQTQLEKAQPEFADYLTIIKQLAGQDPGNANWQRDLAMAHSRVGGVLLARGQLAAARTEFEESFAITLRRAGQDPGNADWQRDLAVAHDIVGDVLQAQGQLAAAQAAFAESLTIGRRLAEQDPGNAGWQRDLAVAHGKVGNVLQAQGQLAAAHAAYAEDLAIIRRLAGQDPTNANWQHDLAVAHSLVGVVLQAQDQLAAAQAAFAESLAISRRLAEQDPSNAGWQHGLAVACVRLARAESQTSKNKAALKLYEESLRIFTDLVARAPEVGIWQDDKKLVEAELKTFREEHSWFSAIRERLGRFKIPF